tara:strand:+ start:464 stop:664 length:201 start_codon:yes stop_codon:yes gene_type:complete
MFDAFEYDGRFYAYAYCDGPLVQVDELGHTIAIVVDIALTRKIEEAMRESVDPLDEILGLPDRVDV